MQNRRFNCGQISFDNLHQGHQFASRVMAPVLRDAEPLRKLWTSTLNIDKPHLYSSVIRQSHPGGSPPIKISIFLIFLRAFCTQGPPERWPWKKTKCWLQDGKNCIQVVAKNGDKLKKKKMQEEMKYWKVLAQNNSGDSGRHFCLSQYKSFRVALSMQLSEN